MKIWSPEDMHKIQLILTTQTIFMVLPPPLLPSSKTVLFKQTKARRHRFIPADLKFASKQITKQIGFSRARAAMPCGEAGTGGQVLRFGFGEVNSFGTLI